MTEILQKDNPLLRQTARLVPPAKIASPATEAVIKKMMRILDKTEDGLALAAPQIGTPLRIFVVSGKLFPDDRGRKTRDLVFINPEIKNISKKKKTVEEGCLSTRWLYGRIKRAEKITIAAYDETGRKLLRNGSGLLAQVFQHEIDHLNGILFIDSAQNLLEIKSEKEKV